MKLPLIIGKNSDGGDQYIDLAVTPLLMISYSTEQQLIEVLGKLLRLKSSHQLQNYIIASSKNLQASEQDVSDDLIFLKDEPEQSTVKSRLDVLKRVQKEIKRRKGVQNKREFPYQFLIVDDVWDSVISKPKSIGLLLMNILLEGTAVRIHTILASGISCRNLLQQLLQLNPSLIIELEKKFGNPVPKQMNVLGAELIFTPDDLIFLKQTGEMEIRRFFR